MIKISSRGDYPLMQTNAAGGLAAALGGVQSQEGSREAIRPSDVSRVVEENFRFVWRLLRRLGLSANDADDGAQQVFMVYARRADKVRAGSTQPFLFGTAIRVAARMRRARARRPEIEQLDPSHSHYEPAPDELLEQRRARQLLDGILGRLTPDLRHVFILYELEQMTMAEIAELLSIKPGTVASRLRRARAQFAQRLEQLKVRHRRGERP